MILHRHRLIGFMGALMVLWPIWTTAEDIAFVQVLDDQFRLVRKLTSTDDLAAFRDLWSGRVKYKGAAVMRPRYKIDVREDHKGARWLYDPDGFVQVLSKAETPVYQLPSPAAFNKLLGIDVAR